MFRNLVMRVAYDGTEFFGWQEQQDRRTVQLVLREAIQRAVRHRIALVGSGRTDRGVHAAAHVSSFYTSNELPPQRLRHSIGARLPDDVDILDLRNAREGFHATRSAISKLYRYRIHNARRRPVEHGNQRRVYHCWRNLDVRAMREAGQRLVGTHDFVAMAGKGAQRLTTVRTVLRCDVTRHLDEVRIDVEGDGFLYKQVRNMAGTLLNVGRGLWSPSCVTEILDSRDRANAGPTMPARGLTLLWVRYPGELLNTDSTSTQSDLGSQTPDRSELGGRESAGGDV